MEELISILEEIQPDADYETCETLIDDNILDSFAILSIISELEEEYDIRITPAEIIPSRQRRSFPRTLTLPRRFMQWSRDFRADTSRSCAG